MIRLLGFLLVFGCQNVAIYPATHGTCGAGKCPHRILLLSVLSLDSMRPSYEQPGACGTRELRRRGEAHERGGWKAVDLDVSEPVLSEHFVDIAQGVLREFAVGLSCCTASCCACLALRFLGLADDMVARQPECSGVGGVLMFVRFGSWLLYLGPRNFLKLVRWLMLTIACLPNPAADSPVATFDRHDATS